MLSCILHVINLQQLCEKSSCEHVLVNPRHAYARVTVVVLCVCVSVCLFVCLLHMYSRVSLRTLIQKTKVMA